MKAASLKSNKVIKIIDKQIPNLHLDECLIKVHSCGVCSSDIYRGFDNGAYFYPLTMGHEFSGTIENIGKNVKDFKISDNVSVFPLLPCFECNSCKIKDYVTCKKYKYYGSRNDGAFCEYIVVKSWNLIKIDHDIDLYDASFLEPLSVVVHGLKRLNLFNRNDLAKKNICIIGCGFLGLMLNEILSNQFGLNQITLIDRNSFKLDFASNHKLMSKVILDSDEDWIKYLDINHNSFDIIFEMSGYNKNFERSINLSKPKGEILWLGNINNDLLIPKKTVSSILRNELKIIGTWNSNFKNKDDDWIDSLNLIRKKIVTPKKYVTNFIKLDELPESIKKMFSHKTGNKRHNYIKYCVNFNENK
jgi:L-iditol 2-dehydrogenase